MNSEALAFQLRQDAGAGIPPFGAESVEMARRLGKAATGQLLEHIHERGKTAFLALEALRSADESEFGLLQVSERAKIYADGLANSIFFNAWGVPSYQLSESSLAVIALGTGAIPFLVPLLNDGREAPLSGSRDATTSRVYGNRVRDYAWILISRILSRPYVYAKDPSDRDRQIAELRQALDTGEETSR